MPIVVRCGVQYRVSKDNQRTHTVFCRIKNARYELKLDSNHNVTTSAYDVIITEEPHTTEIVPIGFNLNTNVFLSILHTAQQHWNEEGVIDYNQPNMHLVGHVLDTDGT